jgi:hypothetical protein
MSAFDPTKHSTLQSNRRGGRTMANPLLRIEGETITYAELSERFGVREEVLRQAVSQARGLKAGLCWTTLHLTLEKRHPIRPPHRAAEK